MELLGDAVNAATRNSPDIATPVILRTDQLDVRGGKLKISPDPWDMAANSLSSVARLGDPDRICIFCGKPVIYLFAPSVVDAAARLTLMRHWHLSAVYPAVQQTKSIAGGDTVEWQARVHPDGILTERTTGLDMAYLFWEALTNHDVPMTPRGSPPFNPIEPFVAQSDGFRPSPRQHAITPYLDEALRKFGLHTTSFIRGAYLVHNAAYERAAHLEITLAPDVVTRVFMIFKGVAELEAVAGEWNEQVGPGDPALLGM
ncbi:hypothetical protein C8R44DRAFT_891203 [Mycena epipterygia]|nr:hypothetical protein C8R44DRAFT_891203 [Mycena epipterygia]